MKNLVGLCLLILPLFLVGQQTNYPFQNEKLSPEKRTNDVLKRLTLTEKVSQMQDVSPAIERLGIPEYNWWNECLHGVARAGRATSFPQAIGMAATWNTDLIHKVADVISTEARAKFNHSIRLDQRNRYQGLSMWTPNINIFRDPRWGRGQETYGEDPFLTSRMAVAFVTGLQGDDPNYIKVIATPKHFAVHSGPEYNRHSFDAYTDKRDLWETYLPAFKAAVVEGKAFSVMSAYNRYLGASATASKLLLNDILRDQWGFEGYVVSDCGAVYDIYEYHKIVHTAEEASAMAVKAGCDLNCGNSYKSLVKAVEKGLIEEEEIDTALARLFIARFKLGLLDTTEKMPFREISTSDLESKEHQELAIQTARESMVLLKNEKETLPLSKNLKSIVVIGPNANDRHFALGNYFGVPSKKTTILEGIQQKVSKKTKVHYFKGTNLTNSNELFDIIQKEQFPKGVTASYFDNSNLEGSPVRTVKKSVIDYEWGGAAPIDLLTPGDFSITYEGTLVPDFSGEVALGVLESGGSYTLFVDGEEQLSSAKSGNGTEIASQKIAVKKGEKYEIKIEYKCTNPWMASIQLLWNREAMQGKQHMWDVIAKSDAIVYVGGITARLEGEEMPVDIEGFHKGDRTNLQLPKAQLNLLKELKETVKPIVFVLTTGSAMAINWSQKHIPAILNVWYPGQGAGIATADIIFGDYNPSGKLPVTFYKSVEDLPPFEDYHMKGRTYRFFEGEALYPFGHGLSYSKFEISTPELKRNSMHPDQFNEVKVLVTNAGEFDGDIVVQLYVNDKESSVSSPLKTLRKFKKVFFKKGETKQIVFEITPEDLSIIDKKGKAFVESGMFEIFVGKSSSTKNVTLLKVD